MRCVHLCYVGVVHVCVVCVQHTCTCVSRLNVSVCEGGCLCPVFFGTVPEVASELGVQSSPCQPGHLEN